jgi:hypothetical protein
LGVWFGAVPGYVEIVREGAWPGRVAEAFAAWAAEARPRA